MYQIVTSIQTFPLPLVSCCATWTWMKCIKDSGPCWLRSALWLCRTQRLIDGCFFRHLTSFFAQTCQWPHLKRSIGDIKLKFTGIKSACTTKYWVLLMPCVILSCVYYSFQSLRLRQRNIQLASQILAVEKPSDILGNVEEGEVTVSIYINLVSHLSHQGQIFGCTQRNTDHH